MLAKLKPGVVVSTSFKSSDYSDKSSISGVPVFDRTILDASTMGDVGLQAEVLGMFRTQLDDVIRHLSHGIVEAEREFVAHTLRGTAAAVGACEIAAFAVDWEAGQPLAIAALDDARRRFESVIHTIFDGTQFQASGAA